MTRKILSCIGLAIAIGAASRFSDAAMVVGIVQTGIVQQPAANIAIHVPKFDAALGNLFGMTLTFHGEVLPSYEVSNGNFFDVSMGPVMWTTNLLFGPQTNYTEGCGGNPGACFIGIVDSVGEFGVPAHTAPYTVARLPQIREAQVSLADVTDLSQFIGSSQDFFTFYFSASTLLETHPGAPAASPIPKADYQASISYRYAYEQVAAVPLPAGLPLLLSGLGFLGFTWKRRTTSS